MPATVRLSNDIADEHITSRLSGLSYRSMAPAGFGPAAFTLQSPIDINNPLLAPFTRMYIYDSRSGETLWEGLLQAPGRTAGDQGEVWSLQGNGPAQHTLDRTAPLVYIDRRLDGWIKDAIEGSLIPPSANAGPGSDPALDNTDVIMAQFADGSAITSSPSSRASAGYSGFVGSGMEIGAFAYSWDAGTTSTNYQVESVVGASGAYTVIVDNPTLNSAGGSATKWVVDDFAGGKDVMCVRVRRVAGGATTIAGDSLWASFRDLRVLGRRMDKTGTLVSGALGMGSSSIYVRASWVVADLLGRLLTQYDGANASITAADTTDIDQLAYLDGANVDQILQDLMKLEPGAFWMAGASNAAGLFSFEWKNWPTSPRYEASVEDGFDSPAPAYDVYNRITVRWKDTRGRIQRTVRTQAIAELDAAGITREWFEDLSDEIGSSANAIKVGDNFLAEHRVPNSGGTLTVARPIVDVISGRRIDPWQIQPGELIRVRGVEASVDTGQGTDRDGQTIFRIVSRNVTDEGVATLELDHFTVSEARALIDLQRKRFRRR